MSDNLAWIIWTVLGVLLIIAEVFTPGFVLLWFGVGALAAAFGALLGVGLPLQFLIFLFVSITLTAASRTIFVRYFTRDDDDGAMKFGAEALPGKVGTVVTSSRGAMSEGAVKVFGSVWTAYPAEGEPPLEAGDRVVVESLRGASIFVRRLDSIPDWRGREITDGATKEEE
jgi:membrane protein implicated in regulation of membrane protease activity